MKCRLCDFVTSGTRNYGEECDQMAAHMARAHEMIYQ